MNITFSLLLILLFMGTAFAGPLPNDAQNFCANRRDPDFVKDLTRSHLNLMAFSNHGGIINGGVCWWHSRFQRNALYLTVYEPQEKKPTLNEAKTIIREIRRGDRMVVIPGYENFFNFSREYGEEIQEALNDWQKEEGLAFTWIRGLRGEYMLDPEKLQEMMDETYAEVEGKNKIVYQKLQIKGIKAHSWLVVHMKKTEEGYDLEVLDSNSPFQILVHSYAKGSPSLFIYELGDYVPYTERNKELDVIERAIEKSCN